MNMISLFRLPMVILFALTLAACGGGSTNSSDSSGGDTTTSSGGSSEGGGGSTTPGSGGVGTALLSWMPPTTNADGSALTDLAGYKIYYGTSPGSYSQMTTTGSGLSSYLIENLASGTWYFAVSAFDTSGNESAKSNEASKSI